MLFQNRNFKSDGDLQNQFTAYLVRAVHRKRSNWIKAQIRRLNREVNGGLSGDTLNPAAQQTLAAEWISFEPLTFDRMYFENEQLENALRRLTERDRFVLFARVMEERSFENLALCLGMGYKGAAAVYYRALRKLREEMEENGDEIR